MEIDGGRVSQGRSRARSEALRQEGPVRLRSGEEASGRSPERGGEWWEAGADVCGIQMGGWRSGMGWCPEPGERGWQRGQAVPTEGEKWAASRPVLKEEPQDLC